MHPSQSIERLLFCAEIDQKLTAIEEIEGFLASGHVIQLEGQPRPSDQVVFPERPLRVDPRALKRRSLKSPEGLRVFLHAIAHIEFSAIHLAVDAAYRFRDLPETFLRDWLGVAVEEARHFEAVVGRMRVLGADYGDYPAHAGLWELAIETAHDPLVRMALVPRCMEARGLDVAPQMIEGLKAENDWESVALLEMILREEIGHVAIGTRWYREIAISRQLDPEQHFFDLVTQYLEGDLKGPFNREARRSAGFSEGELNRLDAMEIDRKRSRIRIPS